MRWPSTTTWPGPGTWPSSTILVGRPSQRIGHLLDRALASSPPERVASRESALVARYAVTRVASRASVDAAHVTVQKAGHLDVLPVSQTSGGRIAHLVQEP